MDNLEQKIDLMKLTNLTEEQKQELAKTHYIYVNLKQKMGK